MQLKCLVRCFHEGKLWEPGEMLEPSEGKIIPPHFEQPKTERPKKNNKSRSKEKSNGTKRLSRDLEKARP
jgi:hypothetical protein